MPRTSAYADFAANTARFVPSKCLIVCGTNYLSNVRNVYRVSRNTNAIFRKYVQDNKISTKVCIKTCLKMYNHIYSTVS